MIPREVAYVAGPYRSATEWGVVQNIRAAEEVALALWRMGYAVICPHKNTGFFGGTRPDEVWLDGDLAILRRCDLVVVCRNWITSSGTREEIKDADSNLIPVYFWPYDKDELEKRAQEWLNSTAPDQYETLPGSKYADISPTTWAPTATSAGKTT